MRINFRHRATAIVLAAAFSVLGSAAAQAAATPGTPAPGKCHEWDSWKYDSCRHDGNKCTFRADYVYYDKYGRYNEEGTYHCTVYPQPTPYARS